MHPRSPEVKFTDPYDVPQLLRPHPSYLWQLHKHDHLRASYPPRQGRHAERCILYKITMLGWDTENLGKMATIMALCHYASSEARDCLWRCRISYWGSHWGPWYATGTQQTAFCGLEVLYVHLIFLCDMIGSTATYVHHCELLVFRTLSIVRILIITRKRTNTKFRKLDLFPSSGEGRHLFCWIP
jgi:hypothetical protein